jgi:hypothetical protein
MILVGLTNFAVAQIQPRFLLVEVVLALLVSLPVLALFNLKLLLFALLHLKLRLLNPLLHQPQRVP